MWWLFIGRAPLITVVIVVIIFHLGIYMKWKVLMNHRLAMGIYSMAVSSRTERCPLERVNRLVNEL